jgi:hypothetical protein
MHSVRAMCLGIEQALPRHEAFACGVEGVGVRPRGRGPAGVFKLPRHIWARNLGRRAY